MTMKERIKRIHYLSWGIDLWIDGEYNWKGMCEKIGMKPLESKNLRSLKKTDNESTKLRKIAKAVDSTI